MQLLQFTEAFYDALNGYYHEDFAACLVIKYLMLLQHQEEYIT